MNRQGDQGDDSANNRIPVQYPWRITYPPVSPKGKEEVTISAQGNPADDVGQGCPKEDRQNRARDKEESVKEGSPDAGIDLHPQLNAGAAHDEQPEHDHQRQVKTAERGGIEERKGKIQSASSGEQPDFVPVP